MAITTYQAVKVLEYCFGKQSFTPVSTLYLGLSTTLPTIAGGNITEPSGYAYSRQSIDNTTSAFWGEAAANGSIPAELTNDNGSISFSTSTGDWGTIGYICIFDLVTGGNLLYWEALGTPRAVPVDTQVIFPTSSIVVKMVNS